MRHLFSILFLALFAFSAQAADNIIGNTDNAQLVDNLGHRWNAHVAYTTNGNGDVYTLGGLVASDNYYGDNVSGVHLLLDNAGRKWGLDVMYTTDGAGNVIPITGGGSSPVTSVFSRIGAVTAQSGDYTTTQVTEGTNLYFTNSRAQGAVSASPPLVDASGVFSIPGATTSVDGYLKAVDWTAFNGKQASISTSAAPSNQFATGFTAPNTFTYAQPSFGNLSGQASLTTQVSGVLPFANMASQQVNKYFYVDGQRTDSYTADGSIQRPFKTVGAAVAQVITNADNASNGYVILVQPGAYSEILTLNNALLYNLIFQAASTGGGGLSGVSIGTGPTALVSNASNTNLGSLVFNGFNFNGSVNLTGDITATNFGSVGINFINGQFNVAGAGAMTLTNVNNVEFQNMSFNGSGIVATFTNVAFGYMQGVEGFKSGSTLHLVDNPGGNVPSQYSGNYFLQAESKFNGTLTIDAGSEWDVVQGYISSASSITSSGTIHSFQSKWSGAMTLNSGSSTRVDGDNFLNSPTINAGATFTNRGESDMARLNVGSTAVAATNALIVAKDGHYKSTQTTAPTVTVQTAGAGAGSSCAVSHATDMAGTVSITTAGTPSTGAYCNVNFNKAYGVAPICTLTPAGSTISASVYASSSTALLAVNFAVAGTTASTYAFNYQCVETQ